MTNVAEKIIVICDLYYKQLPLGVLKDIKENLEAGEEEIAFQELCNYLNEYSVLISKKTFESIQLIGKNLVLDECDWDFLELLIR